ncbi:MAG TPA: nitrite/sulfite reductase, partial [Terriglobales bacterium]|nr:nitrite/sulfite reductase [Terriglobales bacterium]
RKFKIAFSGCEDDGNCAVAGINDIGCIARVGGGEVGARRGFKVMIGGGLGSLPTEAATFAEFVPEEELLPVIEATLRVFSEHGNRKNRHKARMKFVLREKGIDELRRLIEEKRKSSQLQPEILTVAAPMAQPLVNIAKPLPARDAPASEHYQRWFASNVMPQRQPGYVAVWIKVAAGGIGSVQLRGLAEVLDLLRLPAVRIAILQDLVVPWVPSHRAQQLYTELERLELATPGARTIADVTGCPGATTCNLGITRSLTLAEELAALLADQDDPEVLKLRIKISGCPNSCGQHHIADIGLYGNSRKLDGRQAPFYQLMLGGQVTAQGVRFARQTLVVAARQVPQTIRALLSVYQAQRALNESFTAWLGRTPEEQLVSWLQPHAEPPPGSQEKFLDWGDSDHYSLQLGRGECAS